MMSLETCPLTLGGMNSLHFTSDYAQEISKQPPTAELATYVACKRLFARLSVHSVIYPYEGKGLERAVLKALSEQTPSVRSIAYAHAIHNPGHLFIRFHHEELLYPLIPTSIASTGPSQLEWLFHRCGLPLNRLVLVGSSRHSDPLVLYRTDTQRNQCARVLFIAGLGHELQHLANLMREAPFPFEKSHLTIRKYPYSWQEEQDAALEKIRLLCPQVNIQDETLQDQLADCDVVLIGSTSAALEAMLSKRPVICVDVHGILDLNPFSDKGRLASVPYCRTSQDLKESLNAVRLMDQTAYEKHVSSQWEAAREFFAPPMPETIANLLRGP